MKLRVPESAKVANSNTPMFVDAVPFVQCPSR